MIVPRGLLAAALAFWGASNDFTVPGVVLGLALEALRWVPTPQSMSKPGRLAAIVRVCIFLAIGSLVYAIAVGRFPHALYAWLRWLPLDRKSTRLNSSHIQKSRMPSSA